ncbi:MAG: hydrogenase expression/formation protein HypE, partial [Gemmatimonadetes bacterium]|nr:hydrogenase expression/formation protein HypE [Gemmatimonadota bacterium]
VEIVTGDTKVVDRGHGDGVYINTAGVGSIRLPLDPDCPIRPGDAVVLSGDIGRHGIAIMAEREGIAFRSTIESDCAPLNHLVTRLLDRGIVPRCMRDLTRGGLATAIVELAAAARVRVELQGEAVAVEPEVRGACELLGLDPLYVANEGRMIAIVPAGQVDDALAVFRAENEHAGVIGYAGESERGGVNLISEIGTTRRLDLLSGEQLPRIC